MDKNERARHLYLEIAGTRLQEQFQRSRGMDARAATTATIASAVAGIAAVLLKDFSGAGQASLGAPAIVLAALVATAFLAAMACSLSAMWPRKNWRESPRLRTFLAGFDEYPEQNPVEWTGRQLANCVRKNEPVLNAKGKAISSAMWLIMIMGVLTIMLGIAANT